LGASKLSPLLEEKFRFRATCSELQTQSLLRQRLALNGRQGRSVQIGTEILLNFCSNDYLGLAADPRLASALKAGVDMYGVGAGASALVCGRSRAHAELEQAVADFTGRDRALLFCSGYMANLALGVSGLVGAGDWVIADRLNHASLIDAARICGARLRRYPHCDHHAAAKFMKTGTGRKLVLTDGVFSMDGDLAPVSHLAQAAFESAALLAVDDAHGLGVLGHTGGGTLQAAGISQSSVPVLVGTFGKAVGTAGAFIAGPTAVIEFLCQRARTYMYTTAPPPALAHATRIALDIIKSESGSRARLTDLITYFHAGAVELGLPVPQSRTPIQPLLLGSPRQAVSVSAGLRAAGILVMPVRPPTVPAATSRLRITITAAHTRSDLDRLLQQLACLLNPGQ
jgi:8-amino-7-oxononanoate synthase